MLLSCACPSESVVFVPYPPVEEIAFVVQFQERTTVIEGPYSNSEARVLIRTPLSAAQPTYLVTLPKASLSSLRSDVVPDLAGLELLAETESCSSGRLGDGTLRLPLPAGFSAQKIEADGLAPIDDRERLRLSNLTLVVPLETASCGPPLGSFQAFGVKASLIDDASPSEVYEEFRQIEPVSGDRLLARTSKYLYLLERGAPLRTDARYRMSGLSQSGLMTSLSIDDAHASDPLLLVSATSPEDAAIQQGEIARFALDGDGLRFVRTETITSEGLMGVALDPTSRAVVAVGVRSAVYTATAAGVRYQQAGRIGVDLEMRRMRVTGVQGGLPGLMISGPQDAVALVSVDASSRLQSSVELLGELVRIRAQMVDRATGQLFVVGRLGAISARLPTGVWADLPYSMAEFAGDCGGVDACGHRTYGGYVPDAVHIRVRGVPYLVLIAEACVGHLLTIRLDDGCAGALEVGAGLRLSSIAFDGTRLLVGGNRGLAMEAWVEPE